MKELFGPAFGFRVVNGPPGVKRLDLYISPAGIEHIYMEGVHKRQVLYPLEQVSASVENGRLVLQLGDQTFVVEAKDPARYVRKIDEVKASCVVCGERNAPAECCQCGRRACARHSNLVNDQVYCVRCKIVCPRCRSEQFTAQQRGFSLGRALVGTAVGMVTVGGVLAGALAGAAGSKNAVLTCLSCGHRWQPGQ